MPYCDFLHPLRSIRVGWETCDGEISLIEYTEREPDLLSPDEQTAVVITPAADLVVHRFPTIRRTAHRYVFEAEQFFTDAERSAMNLFSIKGADTSASRQWDVIMGYSSRGLTNPVNEIVAACMATVPDGDCFVCGVFPDRIVVALQQGSITDIRSVSWRNRSVGEELRATLTLMAHDHLVSSLPLVLFGDALSRQTLNILMDQKPAVAGEIKRLQPFRHISSTLDDDSNRRILSRTHILGCIVGAIFMHENSYPNPLLPVSIT